ncbi:MAG: FGGY family carbohydrate kinase [Myxococcales bacterium]|nr:FGGY family carbohydrate kinase [Polyangiaceae bacterium]MDW8248677.1 FGGY family carbohydrate kinase [Myxococcales bacterium]
MARLVLGIDSSTTACKAIAWNASGQVVAEGRAAIPLNNPEPGAYEQDPEQLWNSLVEAVHTVVHALGTDRTNIEALSIAHQRETFLLTNDHGQALAPALVWMDSRCVEDVVRAEKDLGRDFLLGTTGKFPCTTPSFYKLLGMFRRRPELRDQRPWFLDVHGFLTRRLLGEFITSLASADPLGILSLQDRKYSEPLLRYAGIALERVARLVEPGHPMGPLTPEAAKELGLPTGTLLVAGAGDGQAAGLGAGVRQDQAYLNLGTALVCGRQAETYLVDRGYRTLIGAIPGTFFLEGDLKAGTFLIHWLTGTLLGTAEGVREERIRTLEREATSLPPGASGLLLLPYWNGAMNPYWDDRATGALIGLRGDHGAAHLFRAIWEGLAMESRLHLEELEQAGAVNELVVMGGGARSDLFCRILTDVTGRPVIRSGSPEATCLGAAVLAAIGAGWFPSMEQAIEAMTYQGEVFAPGEHHKRYDALYREVYRPLYPALVPTLTALARWRGEE